MIDIWPLPSSSPFYPFYYYHHRYRYHFHYLFIAFTSSPSFSSSYHYHHFHNLITIIFTISSPSRLTSPPSTPSSSHLPLTFTIALLLNLISPPPCHHLHQLHYHCHHHHHHYYHQYWTRCSLMQISLLITETHKYDTSLHTCRYYVDRNRKKKKKKNQGRRERKIGSNDTKRYEDTKGQK